MKFENSRKKVILFENIRPFHYPVLMYQVWRGGEVYIFDFNGNLKKKRLVRYLINNDIIKRIYIKSVAKEYGDAIDQTEIIYNGLRNNKLSKVVSSLYETDETSLIFKKVLVNEIFKCIYLNRYLSEKEKSSGSSRELYFVPDNYKANEEIIKKHGSYNLIPLNRIKILRYVMLFLPAVHFLDKLKFFVASFLYISLQIILINLGSLIKGKQKEPVHFEYAIPIDQVFQIKFKGERGFDFLLDHKKITKENTVFILNIPINDDWVSCYEKKGYNFFVAGGIYSPGKIIKVRHNCLSSKALIKVLFEMFACWKAFTVFMYAFFISLRTFVNWRVFSEHMSFSNYIYTNQEGAEQLAINILVRKQGGATWNYACFLGGTYLCSNNVYNFEEYRHIIWSYLNSDFFIGMNEDVISYYKLHHQDVRKYYAIGSIYSEMVCNNMKYRKKEDFLSKSFSQNVFNNNAKIIAFFDTSFIDSDECETNFQDCIIFYQDLIKLLDSLENILLIIKPAKSEVKFISPEAQWSSPKKGMEIVRLWKILKSNSRVYWAGDSGDAPAIMAFSDLVVTHCMSSPTAEALGARKKAIWYESSDKYRGVMYDKIPGLIAHGYKELEQRIENLLYKISEEEYNEYLDKFIKGKVESHLDGLALTRFRQLLVNSN